MVRSDCNEDCIALDHLVSGADLAGMWNAIDWEKIRHEVFRMQCCIARAAQGFRLPDIMRFQDELVSSPEAKSLAVKEITQKKSRDTPGVDGVLWRTAAEKMYAAYHLNNPGYQVSPVRRIYIPKDILGKYRPLGIATMRDRAVQKLYAFALQPVAETWGDPGSFGYRLFRSARDACSLIRSYLNRTGNAIWVLDADITECFDRISHQWLLEHIPIDTSYLAQVLTSGYVHHGRFYPVSQGVPQGGILSPLLANMALDGLESVLNEGSKSCNSKAIGINGLDKPESLYIRYADDLIFLASSRSLVQETMERTVAFLHERGLTLSEEKTRIVPIEHGFSFLHWHFRKNGHVVRVLPSRASIRKIERKITGIFQQHSGISTKDLIRQLNPLLRSFAYYHREGDAERYFVHLDGLIREELSRLMTPSSLDLPDTGPAYQFRSCFHPAKRDFQAKEEKLLLLSAIPTRNATPVRTDRNPYLDRPFIIQTFKDEDTLHKAVTRDRKRQKKGQARWRMDDYL